MLHFEKKKSEGVFKRYFRGGRDQIPSIVAHSYCNFLPDVLNSQFLETVLFPFEV